MNSKYVYMINRTTFCLANPYTKTCGMTCVANMHLSVLPERT